MTLLVKVIPFACVALCVWLAVRLFNRREKWALWGAAGLALLLAYWGTYRVLLEGKQYWLTGIDLATRQNVYRIGPRYRIEGARVEFLLEPAHQFDRLLRDDYWTNVDSSSGRSWKNPPAPASRPDSEQ